VAARTPLTCGSSDRQIVFIRRIKLNRIILYVLVADCSVTIVIRAASGHLIVERIHPADAAVTRRDVGLVLGGDCIFSEDCILGENCELPVR
jgi:hypothetical protein